ncbi:MAG: hypothetical protein GY798_15390 [Hyphomicrobiales bacterium]|nr:hypothetical protein [Hyphomicrobiales bacterium]
MANNGLVVFSLVEDIDDDDIGFLYATDGTEAGTKMIADFRDAKFGLPEIEDFEFNFFDTFAGGAVFVAEINDDDPTEVRILGFSDGTAEGTVIYKPGDPSPAGDPYIPVDSKIDEPAVSGDMLAYGIQPETGPGQLFVVEDGENPVIIELDDLSAGADELGFSVGNGSGLFAFLLNGGADPALVITDGTEAGSHVVATGVLPDDDDGVVWIGDTLVFFNDDDTTVNAVDYATPGTVRQVTLDEGRASLAAVDGGVAFPGDKAGTGLEPYFWDLNSADPELIADLHPGDSYPSNFAAFDGGLLFTANDVEDTGQDNTELYFWDGISPPEQIGYFEDRFEDIAVVSDPAGPGNGTALITGDSGGNTLLTIFKTDGESVSHFDSYFNDGDGGSGPSSDFYLTGEVVLYDVSFDADVDVAGIYATSSTADKAPVQLLQIEGKDIHFATIDPLKLAVEGVKIIGTKGDDIVNLGQTVPGQPLPTAGDDIIRGKKGDDKLSGLGGNDDIKGNRGDDTLKGRKGDDTLDGGKNKDKLKAGKGDDEVTGGGGKDTFIFNMNHGDNVVTDFQNGKDKFDLSGFGFASKAKALSKFSEVGTGNDDQIAFAAKGTEIEINGIDLGQLGGSDLII